MQPATPKRSSDVYSNAVVLDAISLGGFVAGVVSEEMEDVRVVACGEDARYILCVDPLDGSANTDIDGAVATIFAIYRKARPGCEDILAELVGGAVELVSAGYVLYGPSTIFVCTFRDGVHGFTLDTSLGEFLLSHENVRCPTRGRYYSTNVGSVNGWYPNVKKYLAYLNAEDEVTGRPYSLRYSGALVADVHRSLVEGGIYFYPAKGESTEGKLRLLYECAPLAKVVEQAGASQHGLGAGPRHPADFHPSASALRHRKRRGCSPL